MQCFEALASDDLTEEWHEALVRLRLPEAEELAERPQAVCGSVRKIVPTFYPADYLVAMSEATFFRRWG